MILGEYIELLKSKPKDMKVKKGLGNAHSWRGSYSEVAFEIVENTTVGEMLEQAEHALERPFTGWKGGDFSFDKNTDINIDYEGDYSAGRAGFKLLFDLMLKGDQCK